MTPDEHVARINRLAECLYKSCGLPPISIGPMDAGQLYWWGAFLAAMRPLDKTPGGPLRPSDIQAVCRKMRDDNRRGAASWSLRPSSIIRDPERFLDLVLESRRRLRKRPAAIVQPLCAGTAQTLIERDPALDIPQDASLVALVRAEIDRIKARQKDSQTNVNSANSG